MATSLESQGSQSAVEIDDLVSRDGQPAETLSDVVRLVAEQFDTDVCSVYLLEPDRAHLLLGATIGLRQDSVGKLRMGLHEGLAGLVAQRLEPVSVADAAQHPRFKHFRDAGEDDYNSFLGVPLVSGGVLQGVMVIQTVEARTFTQEEVQSITEVAVQLGPVMREARTMEHFIAPSRERLWAIAHNLWWSWNNDGVQLYRDLDPVRWRELEHNPISLLREFSLRDLEDRAGQMVMHSRINHVYHRLNEYLQENQTWGATHAGILQARPVAYFSAEFGMHESMPIYSGGLGILSGDHVKSASDLGVPLVGVGLFYTQGYFHQRLDRDGWQQEEYIDVNVGDLPVEQAIDAEGQPVTVSIDTRTGVIRAKVWRLAVGRVTLLLLDSDVEGNAAEDRELTARLYHGDHRVRIRQELLLGVGGVRALKAVGISPSVLHLNEGHSAFAPLEMIRQQMEEEGQTFSEVAQQVAQHTVFTTHTPVPAGHDRFDPQLVEEHLGPLRDSLGLDDQQLAALGRVQVDDPNETFCMTVLALKLSRRANAVSSLHGHVSRKMWSCMWPARDEEATPIGHITNGVHIKTWLAPQMHELYDRHLGVDWPTKSAYPEVWQKIADVKDSELWETHLTLKSRLIGFVRRHAAHDAERKEDVERMQAAREALSPDTLTIGFARRFATYKRANLLLQHVENLLELMGDPQRPIQFIFAGKAHPLDRPGKTVLREIANLPVDERMRGKILFVEDYDINVARHLVQGVDVWVNNPRRPLEACGTSGQKVVLNGGLNVSVLDGWWAEAYNGKNGFAIGNGGSHVSDEIQDQRDADSLYHVLRDEVIPLYYDRDTAGLPKAWIERMKNAIGTLGWRFSAHRMVMDYVRHCYIPAARGTSSEMKT